MASRLLAAIVGVLMLAPAVSRADVLATFVVTAKDIDHVDRSEDGSRLDVYLLPTKAKELQGFTTSHVGKIVIFQWKKSGTEPEQDVSQLVREPINDGVIHFKRDARLLQPRSQPSMTT
jgi:hypothetical protein